MSLFNPPILDSEKHIPFNLMYVSVIWELNVYLFTPIFNKQSFNSFTPFRLVHTRWRNGILWFHSQLAFQNCLLLSPCHEWGGFSSFWRSEQANLWCVKSQGFGSVWLGPNWKIELSAKSWILLGVAHNQKREVKKDLPENLEPPSTRLSGLQKNSIILHSSWEDHKLDFPRTFAKVLYCYMWGERSDHLGS